eukprot:507177-Hanusia_phi.AAC.2
MTPTRLCHGAGNSGTIGEVLDSDSNCPISAQRHSVTAARLRTTTAGRDSEARMIPRPAD